MFIQGTLAFSDFEVTEYFGQINFDSNIFVVGFIHFFEVIIKLVTGCLLLSEQQFNIFQNLFWIGLSRVTDVTSNLSR